MPPEPITPTSPGTRGASRRDLLRGAAVAGVAAWTAPVIVDSLVSPAAAASFVPGCARAEFTLSAACAVPVETTPNQGAGCAPSAWNGVLQYPTGAITATVIVTSGCNYVFTLPAGSGCTFDQNSVARKDQGNQCSATGVLGPGCTQITFASAGIGFVPDRFKLLVTCGGTLCAGGVACST